MYFDITSECMSYFQKQPLYTRAYKENELLEHYHCMLLRENMSNKMIDFAYSNIKIRLKKSTDEEINNEFEDIIE